MKTDDDLLHQALTNWGQRMAMALRLQAEAFDVLVTTLNDKAPQPWSQAAQLTLQERPLRQALLLATVQLRASQRKESSIPRREWLRLAEHYGYDRRGTAGFFRRSPDGTPGLLSMDSETQTVRVASAGFRRIDEYQPLIRQHEERIEEAAAACQGP